ncbi:MAG: rRNA maturation RNase YbeY [Pseudomonadota bacterium]
MTAQTIAVEIDVLVNEPRWGSDDHLNQLIEKAVIAALSHASQTDYAGELSVLLTNDAEVQTLNASWRDKEKPTNVLSFPPVQLSVGDTPGPLLGDIALSYETVAREAEEAAKSMRDHTFHLIVHGVLHLLGYDHEEDTAAEQMERLETKILAANGIANPYIAIHDKSDEDQ